MVWRVAVVALLLLPYLALGLQGHRADTDIRNDWVDDELQFPCVANSSLPGCATYTYPTQYAMLDLSNLCTQMPFMPTCTVLAACNSATAATPVSTTNQHLCEPVNLLATACRLDGMAGMRGCTGYNSLCSADSAVQQCISDAGISTLPTTATANELVKSICEEMSMDGCEKCTPDWAKGKTYASCDLMSVYSQLCREMPGMGQCAAFAALCSADATLYLCTAGGSGHFRPGPSMLMYFNAQQPFYLLFKDWTPGPGLGSYLAAWCAIFALGVAFELLQVLKSRMEGTWARAAKERADRRRTSSSRSESGAHPHKPPELTAQQVRRVSLPAYRVHWEDAGRAALTLITMGVAYLLMLSAMSFNTGIFFAVILGVATGTLLFGQFRYVHVVNGALANAHSNDMACCTGA